MFAKILIANRGEVAVRIIRACKEMGIATVAVYSEADIESIHVALADDCICIGPAPARDSYLNMARIISAAQVTGAQAIHPGYGFLSENAAFAALCRDNGLAFIGPNTETMAQMGDKDRARQVMRAAGVPVVPGTDVLESAEAAAAAAEKIGYPVLLKARSGGGGKGIRLVHSAEELPSAFRTAAKEAQEAFRDGALYMEKFISPARHVEVQILADETGRVVSLGERACSIQRHNQKLLEEAPAPGLSGVLREKMQAAAVAAAKAVGYVNAGTVEFLLDKDDNFYFMEMNVRLQVEHAVTEQLTGIDLVKWQIRIADGVPLDFDQEDIQIRGSSIECRINAKTTGKVDMFHVPGGPMVRFDSALWTGYTVPPYYDSLLGKLIVFAGTRTEAIRKMRAALCELVVEGVPNNIEEQLEIIGEKDFVDGTYDTDFMKRFGE